MLKQKIVCPHCKKTIEYPGTQLQDMIDNHTACDICEKDATVETIVMIENVTRNMVPMKEKIELDVCATCKATTSMTQLTDKIKDKASKVK
jgi:hypothetical protein